MDPLLRAIPPLKSTDYKICEFRHSAALFLHEHYETRCVKGMTRFRVRNVPVDSREVKNSPLWIGKRTDMSDLAYNACDVFMNTTCIENKAVLKAVLPQAAGSSEYVAVVGTTEPAHESSVDEGEFQRFLDRVRRHFAWTPLSERKINTHVERMIHSNFCHICTNDALCTAAQLNMWADDLLFQRPVSDFAHTFIHLTLVADVRWNV